VPLISALCRQR
jgi:hypothetical protein